MARFGKAEVRAYLDERGVPYEAAEHEAVFTMRRFEGSRPSVRRRGGQELFLCDEKKRSYYLVVMPEDKPADLKELRAQLETRRLRSHPKRTSKRCWGCAAAPCRRSGCSTTRSAACRWCSTRSCAPTEASEPIRTTNTATLHVPLQAVVEMIENHGNSVVFVALPPLGDPAPLSLVFDGKDDEDEKRFRIGQKSLPPQKGHPLRRRAGRKKAGGRGAF